MGLLEKTIEKLSENPLEKQLSEQLLEQIDIDQIDRHVSYLSSFDKLSGTKEAEKAANYIIDTLTSARIPCGLETFSAALSDPVESFFKVNEEDGAGILIPSRPRSFSGNCPDGVEAPLVFDPGTIPEEDYGRFKGKLVLAYGFDERYAKLIESYGAAGWIQIWDSPDEEIHEDTVGPVWGTPDLEQRFLELKMPVAAITQQEGRKVIQMLEKSPGNLRASLAVSVHRHVAEVQLPSAWIQGSSEEFVLISNHYDTWYKGAMDNCAANGVTLELARILYENRRYLKRSVCIAWWPGHSNGRYMGSAWFCDNHWIWLKENCVAHLNSDLIGSVYADMPAVRTTGLEGGDYILNAVKKAEPGQEGWIRGAIGRGADQSFWGVDIPFHINPRYERLPEKKTSSAPGTGVPWWHTPSDTYDKIDLQVLKKDARLLFSLVLPFVLEEALPCCIGEYVADMKKTIESAVEAYALGKEEALSEVLESLEETGEVWQRLMDDCEGDIAMRNRLIRLAGGTLNRLKQSSGSAYNHDAAFAWGQFPLLLASFKVVCQGSNQVGPRENLQESSQKTVLYGQTTFVRQKNRMLWELKELRQKMRDRMETGWRNR